MQAEQLLSFLEAELLHFKYRGVLCTILVLISIAKLDFQGAYAGIIREDPDDLDLAISEDICVLAIFADRANEGHSPGIAL